MTESGSEPNSPKIAYASTTVEFSPPWQVFPRIPWGSSGWRMGGGEEFWLKWMKWFRTLPKKEKENYIQRWPEPEGWLGFYEFIEDGVLPSWYLAREEKISAAAKPPEANEEEILDSDRIVWMLRHYLQRPSISVRQLKESLNKSPG